MEARIRSSGLGRHVLVKNGAPSLPARALFNLMSNASYQYEFERRKYAQDLINFDKKFSKLFSGKPRTEDNQDGVSHEEFIEYITPLPCAPLWR